MNFFKFFILVVSLFFGICSPAMVLDWSGGYRFEYTEIEKPSLSSDRTQRKAYGLNYLYLMPKLIATDGLSIHSRFEIFANQNSEHQGSQLGQLWGSTFSTSDSSYNNTTRDNQGSSSVTASQLYMKLSQEYGTLLVGRWPYEFGLGITHNAGQGEFDHWIDTRDMVGFKFLIGQAFFMPMFGRSYDQDPGLGNNSTEQMLQIQYDSEDTGTNIGILFERKNTSFGATTADGQWLQSWRSYYNDSTATMDADYSLQRTSFFLAKDWKVFGFKLEGGFYQSQSGIRLTNNNLPRGNGYGLATEIFYKPKDSKWDLNWRMGIATGDNPNTPDFEGFQFDRNYDVAFLLFNHRVGQRDFLGTTPFKSISRNEGNSYDDESISNVIYFSPRLTYAWTDKLNWINTLTYANLQNSPYFNASGDKALGWEWDTEFAYKFRENVTWVNQFGYLMPGSAFKNGNENLGTNSTFAYASKLSLKF